MPDYTFTVASGEAAGLQGLCGNCGRPLQILDALLHCIFSPLNINSSIVVASVHWNHSYRTGLKSPFFFLIWGKLKVTSAYSVCVNWSVCETQVPCILITQGPADWNLNQTKPDLRTVECSK